MVRLLAPGAAPLPRRGWQRSYSEEAVGCSSSDWRQRASACWTRWTKNQPVDEVSRVLRALQKAGILVHGFLMFGTPFETEEDAEETRRFVSEHADCIQFINPSIMNLAKGSPMAEAPDQHGITAVQPYTIPGHRLDLALYDNFDCVGWGRQGARHYLQRVFLKDPAVRRSFLRTPRGFDSNHSVFFHSLLFPQRRPHTYETAA